VLYGASVSRLDADASHLVLGVVFLAVTAMAVDRYRHAPDGPWRVVVPYVIGVAVIDLGAGAAASWSTIDVGGATAVRLVATIFPLVGGLIDLRSAAALQRAAAYGESLQREAAEVLARATEERFAETLHEVRSTVVALEGGVRCLLPADDSLPAPLARALTGEVERLRSLVCDDSDRTAIRYRATDALEPVLTIARAGGVPVSWRIPDDVWIQGRAADLAQIVNSLVANATRHAPGSPIEVTLEHDGAHVGVRVSDRGPGIPVSEAERVFSRGERGREVAANGEGLGLYIARNVARTAGGDLWVEPRLGGGATFVVALPAGSGVTAHVGANHGTPALRALPRPVPRRRGRQAQQQAWNFS
jgi:two-component system OmpR family sensor kinase